MKKSILIVSVGPVPATSKSNVEGGGLRAWGIAQGLRKNGVAVGIAVPQEYDSGAQVTAEGIKIHRWTFSNLKDLMDSYDSVYVLYSRADLMEFVASHIDPKKQLIVDLYVPIYLELLARDWKGTLDELKQYRELVSKWNIAFMRGDFFLAANQSQYHFYNGALSVFGRNNSLTFHKKLLDVLPYGIHSEEIRHDKDVCRGKLIKKNDFMLLWFGGLYPWFDIKPLLLAMKNLSIKHADLKLVILGGKNPFVGEPGFMKQYDFALEFTKEHGLRDKSVFFVDWIPYDERNNWYLESDLVINLHHKSKESVYSWRTRIIDYIWGELPILTTGGDEATEFLASRNCAMLIEKNNESEISSKIEELYQNRSLLDQMKENIRGVKSEFFWENVTKNLAAFIQNGKIALDRAALPIEIEASPQPQRRKKTFAERIMIGRNILKTQGPGALWEAAKNSTKSLFS